METIDLQNQYKAFVKFQDDLQKNKVQVLKIIDYNKGRHRVIKTENMVYYVVYKREFFQTFNMQFPEFIQALPIYAGEGESINQEYLDTALRIDADELVFIHPDGYYSVDPACMKQFCKKFNLIRKVHREQRHKQLGGEYNYLKEVTYCYPKVLLQKWK